LGEDVGVGGIDVGVVVVLVGLDFFVGVDGGGVGSVLLVDEAEGVPDGGVGGDLVVGVHGFFEDLASFGGFALRGVDAGQCVEFGEA